MPVLLPYPIVERAGPDGATLDVAGVQANLDRLAQDIAGVGPAGPVGPTGAQGPQGATGSNGTNGLDGSAGALDGGAPDSVYGGLTALSGGTV